VATENNSTIVFPLPLELLRPLMGMADSIGGGKELQGGEEKSS
jgi:hypothetical protein